VDLFQVEPVGDQRVHQARKVAVQSLVAADELVVSKT
jgi:hypothetical protein